MQLDRMLLKISTISIGKHERRKFRNYLSATIILISSMIPIFNVSDNSSLVNK